jgi:lysophospholipase L1-like esterase
MHGMYRCILQYLVTILILPAVLLAEVKNVPGQHQIHYLPLGDSYTIGQGVQADERYPNFLVRKLASRGFKLTIDANPAVSGFTTLDVIDYELRLLENFKPDLVTLMIGTNDWVQGRSAAEYREDLGTILDSISENLAPGGKAVIISPPDFGVAPQGRRFTAGRDSNAGLREFIEVAKEAAMVRSMYFVDIFSLSRQLAAAPGMFSADQLHPSGKQYEEWASEILPVVEKALIEIQSRH